MASYNFSNITSTSQFNSVLKFIWLFNREKAKRPTLSDSAVITNVKAVVSAEPGFGLSTSDVDALSVVARGMVITGKIPTNISDLETQYKDFAKSKIESADQKYEEENNKVKDADTVIQEGDDAEEEIALNKSEKFSKFLKWGIGAFLASAVVVALVPELVAVLGMSSLGVSLAGGVAGGFFGGRKAIKNAIDNGELKSNKDIAELKKKIAKRNREQYSYSAKVSAKNRAKTNQNSTRSKYDGYQSINSDLELVAEDEKQRKITELQNIQTYISSQNASAHYLTAGNKGFGESESIKGRVGEILKKFDPSEADNLVTKLNNVDFNDVTKVSEIDAILSEAQNLKAEILSYNLTSASFQTTCITRVDNAKTDLDNQYKAFNSYCAVLESGIKNDTDVKTARASVTSKYHMLLNPEKDKEESEKDIKKTAEEQKEEILNFKHSVAKKWLDGKTKTTAASLTDKEKAINNVLDASEQTQRYIDTSANSVMLKNAKLFESIYLSVARMYELQELVVSRATAGNPIEITFKGRTLNVQDAIEDSTSGALAKMNQILARTRANPATLETEEQNATKLINEIQNYVNILQDSKVSNKDAEELEIEL